MPKRKSVAKIEAVRAWGVERICKRPYLVIVKDGTGAMADLDRPKTGDEFNSVRVRVLREADYQRLRRAAGKG